MNKYIRRKNGKWYFWLDSPRSPALNMAIDETLLKRMGDRDNLPLIRTYEWDRPSISIGYVQKFSAVPDPAGYEIIRRPTGGGIVYHDRDLTYTVIIPAGHPITELDRLESYHIFHRAIIRFLKSFGLECVLSDSSAKSCDRASMRCFSTPTKYDVFCGKKKIAGAAQRRTKEGILHQGSISLEVLEEEANRKTAGLPVKKRRAENNIRRPGSIVVHEFKKGFMNEFNISFKAFHPDPGLLEEAESLVSKKFKTEAWYWKFS